MYPHLFILTSLLTNLLFLGYLSPALAGCGCDKPPPAPAVVIPHVAFPGLSLTLFHDSFQVGQTWNVAFRNGRTTKAVSAQVVSRRALTDPTGITYGPQLVVLMPEAPVGPTSITASFDAMSLTVPQDAFTVIGRPLMVSEHDAHYKVQQYKTVVSADGGLYMSVSGLHAVCKAMEFQVFSPRFPLRVAQMTILNSQGFFIDAFGPQSVDHFVIEPGTGAKSDLLHYFRHSFEQYCADHQPGGPKEVDPSDPNWHLNGTPHVDYSTLIFAITGDVRERPLRGGRRTSLVLDMQTTLGDGTGAWEVEQEEEMVSDDDDDDD